MRAGCSTRCCARSRRIPRIARVAAVAVGALVPAIVLGAAATAAFVLLRPAVAELHGSEAVATGMTWAAPGLFCFALNKVLFGIVNGLRRMRAFAIYTSLRYVLIGGALIAARAIGLPGERLPLIWTVVEGALLVVLAGELVATVALRRCAGWTTWARAHLAYGARGVTATLAQEINSKLDVWMLGAAGTPKAALGIYSLAAALNEGAMQLAVVTQNNLNPVLARALAAGEHREVEALVHRTRRWFVPALAGACVLGAAIFPLAIPWVLHDPAFAAGTAPFAILMAGLALASPYLPFWQVLLMANRPLTHTLFLVVVVAINLAGQAVLIPRLGLTGAALATSLAVVGAALLLRGLARERI